MKYTLIVIAILQLSIFACKDSSPVNPKVPTDVEVVASPVPTGTPLAVSGEITLKPVEYYTTDAERKLIAKVQVKMNEVVQSDCFYNFMASRKMIQTDGKTSKQVADEFRNARGSIPVQFYYSRFTSTRAYRQPPYNTIYINRKYIGVDSDLCDVAGTFAHESIGHSLLNFGHDQGWSASREYSVPYSSDHAFASEPYSMSDSGGCCK
jgi:hypothetical protein